MAIVVHCDKCKEELTSKGAIIFGPPYEINGYDVCDKYHICIKCWDWFVKATIDKPKKHNVNG